MSKSNIEKRKAQLTKVYFPKICKEVSEKTGIAEEKVQKVISHFIITFKFFVDSPYLPKIKVVGLGTFTPNRVKVARRYARIFHRYFEGDIDRATFVKRQHKYLVWLKKLDADQKGFEQKDPTYKNYWRKLFKKYIKTKRINDSIN